MNHYIDVVIGRTCTTADKDDIEAAMFRQIALLLQIRPLRRKKQFLAEEIENARAYIQADFLTALRVRIVEPYAAELPAHFAQTGARLIDIDSALLECGMLMTSGDRDAFKAISLAERANKTVYDVRGVWYDQPEVSPR